jgi:uncharacterized membrane protein
MKHVAKSGHVIAAAAFAVAMSGTMVLSPVQAEDAKVECVGVNACKGHSDCKTANSSCKGHNACKGQGWLSLSEDDCETKGGKIMAG